MKRIFSIFSLFFPLFLCCQGQNFDSLANGYMKKYAEHDQFMGSIVVARAGKIFFERSYGFADVEKDVPNTLQTKFNIGSLTKQFTGLAILQLAQNLKLNLEDPVSKYYDKAPPGWEKITIYHLLTHTSGIPNPDISDYSKGIAQPYTPEELISIFVTKPLDFPPGTKRQYSNSGYYLLGYIIENVSGKQYADYIRENIFKPAGMQNSGYESNSAIIKQRSSGYTKERDTLQNAQYVDWSIPYSAGALYSTVEDMWRWNEALYTEKLLNRKWLERLFTPDKNGYNYGWFIKDEEGRQKFYHEGSNPGYSAFIARYPMDKAFVIVLSNLETSPVHEIADGLAHLFFSMK
jgi:CubicO group peptidase (beta-lactamase class C family)